jgi:hypothetical protein
MQPDVPITLPMPRCKASSWTRTQPLFWMPEEIEFWCGMLVQIGVIWVAYPGRVSRQR